MVGPFLKTKEFFLNLFFPAFCINCQREGNYLCQDCLSLVDFPENSYCPFCYPPKITLMGEVCKACKNKGRKLNGLFFATPYQNFIVRQLILQLKYQPYIKELAKVLALLIIHRLQMVEKESFPQQGKNLVSLLCKKKTKAVLIPVPLAKKKLKQRGFNQAEEITKGLAKFFNLPLLNNVLLKAKETLSQTELPQKEREQNIKGAFYCKCPERIQGKTIFLVDDVFTTGSTMQECARVLKSSGAKSVWGIAIARE